MDDQLKRIAHLEKENSDLRRRIEELETSGIPCASDCASLSISELRFRSLFEGANDAIFTIEDGRIVDCNLKAQQMLGCEREQLLLSSTHQLSPSVQPCGKSSPALFCQYMERALEGEPQRFEWTFLRPSTVNPARRELFETEICLNRVDLPQGHVLQAIARDISERKRMERALAESLERHRIVAEYTYDWEVWLSPLGEVLFVNPACERITGRPASYFMERGISGIRECLHPDDRKAWHNQVKQAPAAETGKLDLRIMDTSGQERWICQVCTSVRGDDGRSLGVRLSMREITERKRVENQLRHESLHDPLTGLANRTLCLDRIARVLDRSRRRYNYHYSVLVIELDRYSQVNESLGHRYGDIFLVQAASRISSIVRSIDTVSRFSMDSFVVILDEMESPREAIKVAKRIRDMMQKPFLLNGHETLTGVNIGIVISPAEYREPEDLLQNASIAMRHAQKTGRNRFKVFNRKLLEIALHNLSLESDLRRAVKAGEFFLTFQPILSLTEGILVGFEALVRWQHPKEGLVTPDVFIPIAEESGIILDLGDWVLQESCRTMADWLTQCELGEDIAISVNLSPRQLSQALLVERIEELLDLYSLPPSRLKLEITESTIMENAESAVDKLSKLRALGIQLSIDDFGTGYSSMNQLSRFPLDHLKIDLSFVQQMHRAPENLEIVKAIVTLAHNLGLKVVAEGIEELEQHGELCTLNCEYGQGYLFSRPVRADDALAFLKSLPTCPESR